MIGKWGLLSFFDTKKCFNFMLNFRPYFKSPLYVAVLKIQFLSDLFFVCKSNFFNACTNWPIFRSEFESCKCAWAVLIKYLTGIKCRCCKYPIKSWSKTLFRNVSETNSCQKGVSTKNRLFQRKTFSFQYVLR